MGGYMGYLAAASPFGGGRDAELLADGMPRNRAELSTKIRVPGFKRHLTCRCNTTRTVLQSGSRSISLFDVCLPDQPPPGPKSQVPMGAERLINI